MPKALFSPKDDEYAFGEMDEVGKAISVADSRSTA
jgi:hypothetical protein